MKFLILKWASFKNGIRKWINTTLEDTHDHYLCYLPKKIGFFSSFILNLFFSGIKVDKLQTDIFQKIPKNAIIIYATKHKSCFDYMFYHTYYKQNGFQFPELSFNQKVFLWQPVSRIFKIFLAHVDYLYQNHVFPDPYESGYFIKELDNGRSAIIALIEKKGFYQRFVKAKTDPLQYLIEMQNIVERPIVIIPHLMFFSNKPHKSNPSVIDILFGTEEKPKIIRRLVTLIKNPGKIFVEISDPVNLNDFISLQENKEQSIEQISFNLRNYLLDQINRHRQSIIGPTLKSREELKETILTNDRLQNFMQQYSKKHNIPKLKVHKEADAYLEEIAANYNINAIKIIATIIRWIIKIMFDGVTVNYDMLSKAKSMSKKGPLILIPCHKSHIDYLILSYIMLNNNMPCPHIAAGKNLSFWPIGALFRGGGAFFIRRSFRGAVLYSKIFSEYIYKLLEEGFNIELFIEGGRSRTGKLLKPQLGLLSILLNAYKNGACEDMTFVPIFIGYDRVLEESSYLDEIEGGKKKPENISQIIKARKFLKKRYGKIYIKVNEPISLGLLLSQNGYSINEMTSKQQNVFCRNLGLMVLNAIDRVSNITPYSLVASAALNCSREKFSYRLLMFHIETYMKYLSSTRQDCLADTLLVDYVNAVEQVIDTYIQRKFIERISGDKGSRLLDAQFKVNPNKRPNLAYYKNNSIAAFIPAAFTAISILALDAFQFTAASLHPCYTFFQEFFKNEFFNYVYNTPEYFVRKNIKAFINDAIIMPHPSLPDTYNLTSEGFRKLKFFAGFLKAYLESYLIVLNYFERYPKNSIKSKDRIKKIQSTGNRMYKRKEIELKEALSKVNYENGVDFFITHGVKSSEDNEKIEFYAGEIKKHLNYLL